MDPCLVGVGGKRKPARDHRPLYTYSLGDGLRVYASERPQWGEEFCTLQRRARCACGDVRIKRHRHVSSRWHQGYEISASAYTACTWMHKYFPCPLLFEVFRNLLQLMTKKDPKLSPLAAVACYGWHETPLLVSSGLPHCRLFTAFHP